jgi:hypothetical protein
MTAGHHPCAFSALLVSSQIRVLNQPTPTGMLKYIVSSASLAKMPC